MDLLAVLTSVLSLIGQAVEICNHIWCVFSVNSEGGAVQHDQQPNFLLTYLLDECLLQDTASMSHHSKAAHELLQPAPPLHHHQRQAQLRTAAEGPAGPEEGVETRVGERGLKGPHEGWVAEVPDCLTQHLQHHTGLWTM